jgi:hypothetical protein
MEKIYRTKDGVEFESESDAIYHEKSLQKNTEINATQMLVFDLIKRASFNGFDGEHTVNYLTKNKDKWVGVMPEVEDYALRDIDDDSFHIDTVLVKCKNEETAKEFKDLLKRNLSPDEISLEVDTQDYNGKAKRIIRMWWD